MDFLDAIFLTRIEMKTLSHWTEEYLGFPISLIAALLLAPLCIQILYCIPLMAPKVDANSVLQYLGVVFGIGIAAKMAIVSARETDRAKRFDERKYEIYDSILAQSIKMKTNNSLSGDLGLIEDLYLLGARLEIYGSPQVKQALDDLLRFMRENYKEGRRATYGDIGERLSALVDAIRGDCVNRQLID